MRVVEETGEIVPLPIYAMAAMPNHWPFLVRPESSDQVSESFRRLTVMHTMRWHAYYKTRGTGHLYQGLTDSDALRGAKSGSCKSD